MEYEIRENEFSKSWHLDGRHHREDGPAIEYNNGDKVWCSNGKIHREGGPAIECVNGDKYWYLNGIKHSEERYWEKTRCKYCEGKYRSIKAINDYIYYCPRCQR